MDSEQENFLTEYVVYKFEPYGKNRLKYPLFSGNFDEVREIHQMQCGIATPENEKPVLATWGLSNCIGVVAYDSKNKLAFLSHSDAFTCSGGYYNGFGFQKRDKNVLWFYSQLREYEKKFELDVKLIIGNFPDKKMIEIVEKTLKNEMPENVELKSLEKEKNESIAIDTRTGELYSYDPKLNPNPATEKSP